MLVIHLQPMAEQFSVLLALNMLSDCSIQPPLTMNDNSLWPVFLVMNLFILKLIIGYCTMLSIGIVKWYLRDKLKRFFRVIMLTTDEIVIK